MSFTLLIYDLLIFFLNIDLSDLNVDLSVIYIDLSVIVRKISNILFNTCSIFMLRKRILTVSWCCVLTQYNVIKEIFKFSFVKICQYKYDKT